MKGIMAILAIVAGFSVLPAMAQQQQTSAGRAQVVAQPRYERINRPVKKCRLEQAQAAYTAPQAAAQGDDVNYVGTAIGGVAGALLGNQVGKGNGKTAATAIGGIVGAIAGDKLARNQQPSQVRAAPAERCWTEDDYSLELTGYDIVVTDGSGMARGFIPVAPAYQSY